jgi:hypothetical protein
MTHVADIHHCAPCDGTHVLVMRNRLVRRLRLPH